MGAVPRFAYFWDSAAHSLCSMSQATDMLAFWNAAEIAVASGQRVRFGERELTRADAKFICDRRDEWQRRVNAETAAASGRDNRYAVADFRC